MKKAVLIILAVAVGIGSVDRHFGKVLLLKKDTINAPDYVVGFNSDGDTMGLVKVDSLGVTIGSIDTARVSGTADTALNTPDSVRASWKSDTAGVAGYADSSGVSGTADTADYSWASYISRDIEFTGMESGGDTVLMRHGDSTIYGITPANLRTVMGALTVNDSIHESDSSNHAGNSDSLGGKDASYYDTVGNGQFLKLDQSTPQAVVNGVPTFTSGIKSGVLRAITDSPTAVKITKSDGTSMMTFDATNTRIGVGTNYPLYYIDMINSGDASMRFKTTGTTLYARILCFNSSDYYTQVLQYATAIGGTKYGLSRNSLSLIQANSPAGLVFDSYMGTPIVFSLRLGTTDTPILKLTSDYSSFSNSIGLGTTNDASLTYDGTNLLVNPKVVGTGKLIVQGNTAINEDLIVSGTVAIENIPSSSIDTLIVDSSGVLKKRTAASVTVGRADILNMPTDTSFLTFADSTDSIIKTTEIIYDNDRNVIIPKYLLSPDGITPFTIGRRGSSGFIMQGFVDGLGNVTTDSGPSIVFIGNNYGGSNDGGIEYSVKQGSQIRRFGAVGDSDYVKTKAGGSFEGQVHRGVENEVYQYWDMLTDEDAQLILNRADILLLTGDTGIIYIEPGLGTVRIGSGEGGTGTVPTIRIVEDSLWINGELYSPADLDGKLNNSNFDDSISNYLPAYSAYEGFVYVDESDADDRLNSDNQLSHESGQLRIWNLQTLIRATLPQRTSFTYVPYYGYSPAYVAGRRYNSYCISYLDSTTAKTAWSSDQDTIIIQASKGSVVIGDTSKSVPSDLIVTGSVGIGPVSPDALLHVYAGNSTGTPNGLSKVVIENDAACALQFLTPNNETQYIMFGDSADNNSGQIRYGHADNSMRFKTNGTTWLTIASDGTINLSTVANAGTDTDKFLVQDAGGNVDYRTGAEVLSDIGAATEWTAYCSLYVNTTYRTRELAHFSKNYDSTITITCPELLGVKDDDPLYIRSAGNIPDGVNSIGPYLPVVVKDATSTGIGFIVPHDGYFYVYRSDAALSPDGGASIGVKAFSVTYSF